MKIVLIILGAIVYLVIGFVLSAIEVALWNESWKIPHIESFNAGNVFLGLFWPISFLVVYWSERGFGCINKPFKAIQRWWHKKHGKEI